ncbi:synaptotagmin-like protein 2 [Xenentodon cancila]
MIDLSFLTEEEQETILVVLRRDAELKKAEEQRVQNLEKTVSDRSQLRFLTGEWFYETKQLRHQDRIHGSDIIRASMKHAQKLFTKLELSYILPERSKFVSSENNEMFDPPEHCGLLQEARTHLSGDGYQIRHCDETVLRSPMKRRNPFSSELDFEDKNKRLVDGKLDQTHVQNDVQEPLIPVPPPTKSSFPPQKNRPAKISELKEGSSAMTIDQGVSFQSDLKMSSGKSGGGHTKENIAKPQVLKSQVSEKDCVSPGRSHLESFTTSVDVELPCQQYIKENPASPNKSQPPRSENKSDKVRKSPSKTYHPKVLPRDSSSSTGSSLEGSPLKTFPIDINPQTEVPPAKTAVTDNNPSEDISPLPSSPDDRDTSLDHMRMLQRDMLYTETKETGAILRISGLRRSKTEKETPAMKGHPGPGLCLYRIPRVDGSINIHTEQMLNTGSSMSDISLSSGMASMSSQVSSISSISPGDCGDVRVQGSIQFAVNYIQKLAEFQIFVVLCRGLAVADTKNNRSDPYVKCYLFPDKTKLGKRKTSAKKKTLNPTFNEVLTYKIVLELLKTQSLNISVWHNNTFGRNSFLGEVDLDLSEWDFSNTQINEYALKTRVSAEISTLTRSCLAESRGQMRVALRFLLRTAHSKDTARTETGEVQIWVKDCKNLPPVTRGIINPFVKCAVLPDTSWKSQQKTRVVKRTESPMFNHTMVYDGFRLEDLREACVELTAWDHDRLKNRCVGGLRLGLGTGKSYGVNVVWMDSTTQEVNIWQRMLQFGGEWVEDVLPLRMLESARSMSL